MVRNSKRIFTAAQAFLRGGGEGKNGEELTCAHDAAGPHLTPVIFTAPDDTAAMYAYPATCATPRLFLGKRVELPTLEPPFLQLVAHHPLA